ncbi:HlyD family secretion protein [Parvularcula oceani]|uniref:HlyD family secretion protein n=1 Tax=Parvularcula oceani TaxID=1247963 RepID=UPI000569FCDA|nr:HlyD family efflux transporter periplasmic adaptor subunit [Parvularcula oceani]
MPFRDRHIGHFRTLAAIKVPRIMRVVAWMLIVALVTAVLFLTFTPWVQTASGPGQVTALDPNDRVQEINALVPGRIDRWFVRDGSRVEEGDPILRIIDNDPQLLERLAAEREQLVAQREAAETALETAQLDLERTRSLFEDGLAARRDFEQAQIRVEELRARVAEANAALSRLDVDISRQSAQLVRAPRDGTILQVNAGDSATLVSAGQTVATFLPANAERAVELFIDGRDIALVHPGSEVRLLFEGWPAVQFSGWPSVAVGTFAGEVVAVDPSAQPDGTFRVLVSEDADAGEPWPGRNFVRIGATARGWVLLDTVPVGYELWRQLNNFPPRYVPASAAAAQDARI